MLASLVAMEQTQVFEDSLLFLQCVHTSVCKT